MNYGELIRKLRRERGFTQTQLAKGISHRTTLASFEQGGETISYDLVMQYLERLNVSNAEFQLLAHRNNLPLKQQLKDEYNLLLSKLQQGDGSVVTENLSARLLEQFEETNDFAYFYWAAELYLLKMVNIHDADYRDDKIVEIKSRFVTYLNNIETFGGFEIMIFINSLYLFELDFVKAVVKRIVSRTQYYGRDKAFEDYYAYLLINLLAFLADHSEWQTYHEYLEAMRSYYEQSKDSSVLVFLQMFELIDERNELTDLTRAKNDLIEKLEWLGLEGWKPFIERNLAK